MQLPETSTLTYEPDSLDSLLCSIRARLLDQLQRSLTTLEMEPLYQLAQDIVKAPACVILGVGKSGLIADKWVATLSSIGVRAFALHPIEAQHGDLGRVQQGDLVLCISNGGESEEIIHLLPSLRVRQTILWAMTAKPNSRLAKGCCFQLLLPAVQELDPFGMVPTTSSILQLSVAEMVSMCVLHLRGVQLADFQANHPAGLIGRRLHLRVREAMVLKENAPVANAEERVKEVLHKISEGRAGCVMVQERCKLSGIFTDGDFRRLLERRGAAALELQMGEVANLRPRVTHPDLLAVEALKAMESDPLRPIQALPVVEHEELVGLLRRHDLVQSGLSVAPSWLEPMQGKVLVSQAMIPFESLAMAPPHHSVLEVIKKMTLSGAGVILVAEGHQLCGLFTDGDLRRLLERRGAESLERSIGEVANLRPRVIEPQRSLSEALHFMDGDPA